MPRECYPLTKFTNSQAYVRDRQVNTERGEKERERGNMKEKIIFMGFYRVNVKCIGPKAINA